MAKRVFDIAKELGIDSKSIVAKCRAEGIPETIVKGHMSTISAGLEATIREWFSEGAHTTTVETADRVDLDKARVAPTKARRISKKREDGEEGADVGQTATAVAAPPAPLAAVPAPAEPVVIDVPAPAPPAVVEPRAEAVEAPAPPVAPKVVRPRSMAPPAGVSSTPPAPLPPPKPRGGSSDIAGRGGASRTPSRVSPGRETSEPDRSTSGPETARPQAEPTREGARPPTADRAGPRPTAPVRAGEGGNGANDQGGAGPDGGQPSRPASPPTMNIPTRPKVVTPAGPKLQAQAPVKLAGPKIIRVEAAESVPSPRGPRRGPGPGDSAGVDAARGPRAGGGVQPSGPGTDDDASPRRTPANKRRTSSSGAGIPPRRRGLSGTGEEWKGTPGNLAGWTEQDLAEREARLAKSGGLLKKRQRDAKKAEGGPGERHLSAAETGGAVQIAAPFTIKDLSAATGVKAADIVKKLFLQGVVTTINAGIDPVKAQEVMIEFDIDLRVTAAKTAEEAVSFAFETMEAVDQRARGPVVTILGHVDHGKTSLLDKIRNANVASGEAGGITQRTSAFSVPVQVAGETKQVVFLDTPGHKAFTEMRSRGASMTDLVVLVVSAPEGVMPQTIESINHAKAAGVPIVVALNKIDRPDATEAQVTRTLKAIADAGLNPVEWGGDTEVVRTSAVTGAGITELLETLDYQAQLLELKADFGGPARGTVVEAKMEEGRGCVASLLVQNGSLSVGDFIVAGRAFGRIRDITDDRGNRLRTAHPPMPVQVSGMDLVPDAGDKFYCVDSLKKAQEAAEQRRDRERQTQLAQPKMTLDSLFSQISDSEMKEIKIILKAAEQGTVDVLKNECESIKHEEVKVRVLHSGVGGITESDVILADASRAVIIGFNVIPSGKARSMADAKGVEIRTYEVIYDITDDLKKAAEGLLAPEMRHEVLGHAEVRKVFKVSRVGTIAGCYVTDGNIERNALIRVTRNDVVIENNRVLEQLKRFKDDAKEVRAGMECGMKIVGYDDIKEGDILECYRNVEVKRAL